jgi:hypothetical protein
MSSKKSKHQLKPIPISSSVYIRKQVNNSLLKAYSIENKGERDFKRDSSTKSSGKPFDPSESRVAFGTSSNSYNSNQENPYRDWGCTDSKLKFMIARDTTFKDREEYLRL